MINKRVYRLSIIAKDKKTGGNLTIDFWSDRYGKNPCLIPDFNLPNGIDSVYPSDSGAFVAIDNRPGVYEWNKRASSLAEDYVLEGQFARLFAVDVYEDGPASSTFLYGGIIQEIQWGEDRGSISISTGLNQNPIVGTNITSDDVSTLISSYEGAPLATYYNAVGAIVRASALTTDAIYYISADNNTNKYSYPSSVFCKTTPVQSVFSYELCGLANEAGPIQLITFQGTTNLSPVLSSLNLNAPIGNIQETIWDITGPNSYTTGMFNQVFLDTDIQLSSPGGSPTIDAGQLWIGHIYAIKDDGGPGQAPDSAVRIASSTPVSTADYTTQLQTNGIFSLRLTWDKPIFFNPDYDYFMGLESTVGDPAVNGFNGNLDLNSDTSTIWYRKSATPTAGSADREFMQSVFGPSIGYPIFRNYYLEWDSVITDIANGYKARGLGPVPYYNNTPAGSPLLPEDFVERLNVYFGLSNTTSGTDNPLQLVEQYLNKRYNGSSWVSISTLTEKGTTCTSPTTNANTGVILSNEPTSAKTLLEDSLQQLGAVVYAKPDSSAVDYKVWKYGSFETRKELGPDEFTLFSFQVATSSDVVRDITIEGFDRQLPAGSSTTDSDSRKGFSAFDRYNAFSDFISEERLRLSEQIGKVPASLNLPKASTSSEFVRDLYFARYSNTLKRLTIDVHTNNRYSYEITDVLRLDTPEINNAVRASYDAPPINYTGQDVEHQTNIFPVISPSIEIFIEDISVVASSGFDIVRITGRVIDHPYEVT